MANLTLQKTAAPTRKVTSGLAIGAPLAVVAIWSASQFGLTMSAEVATAFGALISQAVSYMTRDRVA